MTRDRDRRDHGSGSVLRRVAAAVCLVVPVAALLWVPWYARERPELGGVPFFYWYQLAWVPGCTVGILAAYLLLRPALRPRSRPPSG